MSTVTININLPEGLDVNDLIDAFRNIGISDIASAEEDFIPLDEAMPELFPGKTTAEINGCLLKTARKNKRMTQIQLAELTGTQKEAISAMENGKRTITTTMAKKFGKALNVHYKAFL